MDGGNREGCGTAVESVGGAFYHRLGRWYKRQKKKKINYVMALNGHQTEDNNATINQK
jgi:hypothetical protein